MKEVDNYNAVIKGFTKRENFEEAEAATNALKEYCNRHSSVMQEEFDKSQSKVYDALEEDVDSPNIDHPSHYQSYNPQIKIECIDAMRAAFGDEEVAVFCKLNAFKYNWRASSKGKNVDIGKAIWYLNKYLELNKK